ncbi:MAG: GspE/PulE family protein [Clostridiaceae bacterium]
MDKLEEILGKLSKNNGFSLNIQLVNEIINQGIEENASDIHIEPYKDLGKVKFRIDGDIIFKYNIPMFFYSFLVSRIKVICRMDIGEKRIPQDGKGEYRSGNCFYDLRCVTLPSVFGEKIVIRILKREDKIESLGDLGFSEEEDIKRILNYSNGLILVTGSTGSGKSTTLHSMINEIKGNNLSIVTLEDPVEYQVEDITQINMNAKIGLNFPSMLRSILRGDPDVIMVGEIRDHETAMITARAAITGHKVMSTLHTNSAASSIWRLKDMGVEPYIIASCLSLVISQKLVKKICPYCKKPHRISAEEKEVLGKDIMLYKGAGCDFCSNTGYKGRTAVYELLIADEDVKDKIKKEEKIEITNGIKENALKLLVSGVTSFEEYIKILYSGD